MGKTDLSRRRKLSGLFCPAPALNRRGTVLLLVMVLLLAVMPAALVLAQLARLDLAAALDDYHRVRAEYAARSVLSAVKENLLGGGDGVVAWPDPEVAVTVVVQPEEDGWLVTVTAISNRARVKLQQAFSNPNSVR